MSVNRVAQEVSGVLVRYDAGSDATMEEWVLAELLWAALRLHDQDSARRERVASLKPKEVTS